MSLRIMINQDRRGPGVFDGQRGGDERIALRDDFVVRADTEPAHRKGQGIETAADRNAMFDVTVVGKLLLEGLDLRPEHEVRTLHGFEKGLLDFVVEFFVLGSQINERYVHGQPFRLVLEAQSEQKDGPQYGPPIENGSHLRVAD